MLSIVSFGALIPLLNIIFKINDNIPVQPENTGGTWKYKYDMMLYDLDVYVQNNGAVAALSWVCVVIVILTLLKNLVGYMAMRNIAVIRTGVSRDLREKTYNRLIKLPLSYFSNERKGDIMSRMTNDLMEIEFSVIGTIEILFKSPIMIVISLVTLFLISWKLTIFALIFLPVSGFIISRVSKGLKNAAKRGKDKLGELMIDLEETLGGIRIIKAFNGEEEFKKKYDEKNEGYFHLMKRLYKKEYLASPTSEFISISAIAILLFLGGRIVLEGSSWMDASMFIGYLVIFSQIIAPAKSLSDAIFKMKKGEASIDRINEIINAEISIQDIENPVVLKEFSDSIQFQDVRFKYDEQEVVKGVSFEIKKGQSVALVGPSGGGKSTLANLIARFYDITSGEILVDGHSIKDVQIKSLRDQMGIVTQDSILFNDSIINNITLGVNDAKTEEIHRAARTANANEFIEKLDGTYGFVVGDGGNKLSGGQKQRLSIARALFKNPPILILDEATSALDTKSEKLVQDAINNLMENRTAVVIAHRLSTIQNVDKILVVENGEISQQGTHDELMSQGGTYKMLVEMQELA